MSSIIPTSTYRHCKKEATYLFVVKDFDWNKLPDALQQQFIKENHVTDFDMTIDRKLARAEGKKVFQALQSEGYYLQLPPSDLSVLQLQEDRWVSDQQTALSKAGITA